jgi:IclR family transcriptional regulator, acetate operon repressor
MDIDLRLACSAAGHAWFATLTDQQATEAVMRQGLGDPSNFGPNAPTTVKAPLKMLQDHRKRGFSVIRDVYAPGMSSMAAVIKREGEPATGALVIVGSSPRFTEEQMRRFGPRLMRVSDELAPIGSASPLLRAGNIGTWGNKT